MKCHKPLGTRPINSVIITDPNDSIKIATLSFLLNATQFATEVPETRI